MVDIFSHPPTIVIRHRRENLKKCSLRGLEMRKDMRFFRYPLKQPLDFQGYVLLSFDAPLLSKADCDKGLVLIDGTWRYAQAMEKNCGLPPDMERRSLPPLVTAYPRRQPDCSEPERGMASVEALTAAYRLLGRSTVGLLDHYHWAEAFIEKNRPLL